MCSIAYIECHGAANATTLKEWFDNKYGQFYLYARRY